MIFHSATNGLMLNIAPAHTIKKNTIVNTSQNLLISITLICVKIRTNLAQTKQKKKLKKNWWCTNTKLLHSVVLKCVGVTKWCRKKCIYKKVWVSREKAGRITTPPPTYNNIMSHTIILNRVGNILLKIVVVLRYVVIHTHVIKNHW